MAIDNAETLFAINLSPWRIERMAVLLARSSHVHLSAGGKLLNPWGKRLVQRRNNIALLQNSLPPPSPCKLILIFSTHTGRSLTVIEDVGIFGADAQVGDDPSSRALHRASLQVVL